MKEVKQKVMCQHDTKAAKSCTNRCPNRKKLKQIQKWLLSLRLKQAAEQMNCEIKIKQQTQHFTYNIVKQKMTCA